MGYLLPFLHSIDGAGAIMFSGCPSVGACVLRLAVNFKLYCFASVRLYIHRVWERSVHSRLAPTILWFKITQLNRWAFLHEQYDTILRYDTIILDAILTCARKLTRIRSIYRTEPTTKKRITQKLKSNKRTCLEVSVNCPGNLWSQSVRRKGRLWWEKFAVRKLSKSWHH